MRFVIEPFPSICHVTVPLLQHSLPIRFRILYLPPIECSICVYDDTIIAISHTIPEVSLEVCTIIIVCFAFAMRYPILPFPIIAFVLSLQLEWGEFSSTNHLSLERLPHNLALQNLLDQQGQGRCGCRGDTAEMRTISPYGLIGFIDCAHCVPRARLDYSFLGVRSLSSRCKHSLSLWLLFTNITRVTHERIIQYYMLFHSYKSLGQHTLVDKTFGLPLRWTSPNLFLLVSMQTNPNSPHYPLSCPQIVIKPTNACSNQIVNNIEIQLCDICFESIINIMNMMIITSKSIPKMTTDISQKQALKLPSIIPQRIEFCSEDVSPAILSGCNTKKLRLSKNQIAAKLTALDNQESMPQRIKNPYAKRRSLMQNVVTRASKSVRKESFRSEMEEVYRSINKLIALDYQLSLSDNAVSESVKGVIQKGNNSLLVRQILKARGYWNIRGVVDEEDSSSIIVWTEFRQKNIASIKQARSAGETKKLQVTKTLKSSMMEFKNIFKLFTFPDDSKEELPTALEMKECINRLTAKQNVLLVESRNLKLTNHLPQQQQLSNKKSLFLNLHVYYTSKGKNPFEHIPVTFHLASSTSDPEFQRFVLFVDGLENKKKSLWIIKPGEFTNRGNGITVEKGVEGVRTYLQSFKSKHTYLVQSYIRPYLYCQRKFDMRCYLLVVMMNNTIRGYWYEEGYIRTSSENFSYKKMDKMIHLTNDAVQKHGQNYGKYEAGNKISYSELQKYILKENQRDFFKEIVPKMRDLARDSLEATKTKLGGDRNQEGFEIYGLDYMLDEDLKPWLIEFNTNPCLETGSSLLSRVIPEMLDNAFRVALDPFILDSSRKLTPGYESFLRNNKFQLIYQN